MEKLSYVDEPNKSFLQDRDKKQKAKERFFYIKDLLEENKDKKGLAYLKLLLDTCIRYVNCIVDFNFNQNEIKKKYGRGKDAQKEIAQLDLDRKIIHDALISRLNMINRYLARRYGWENKGGKIPLGGLFTLHHTLFGDRYQIGHWAWYLVAGVYRR